MHYIHAPVLIHIVHSFTFGVVVRKIITETAKGETTAYEVNLFCGRDHLVEFSESDVFELPKPSAYGSYGITAAVERHPGYKWAIAESDRRMNEPELPLKPVAIAPAATEGGVK